MLSRKEEEMKVCIISPASHLESYSILGHAEMALTHLIVEDAGFSHSKFVVDNYVKYFKARTQEGKWTILDNSAYEIGKLESSKASGEGLGPELVLKAAEAINPSIVIAQDILCDREATLESTKNFIQFMKTKNLLGKYQIMGVAQGKTEDEWLQSYEDLYKIPEIDQIGFSKISVPLSFVGNQTESFAISTARLKATKKISELYATPKPAHLLGGDNGLPSELSIQSQYDWIFSNDSSATVQYGCKNVKFDPSSGKADRLITEKPDLENNFVNTVDRLEFNRDTILHNIATLLKFVRGK